MPAESAINGYLSGAYFFDCHAIEVPCSSRTALDCFLTAITHTPSWVNSLMALRNRVVQLFGLKNLGALGAFDPSKPESAYLPGDRVGIFTLIANSDNEVLLGDSDKHLDVVLSVFKSSTASNGTQLLAITTVVRAHNLLGRIYMLLVTPLHKLIAPAVLSRSLGEPNAI